MFFDSLRRSVLLRVAGGLTLLSLSGCEFLREVDEAANLIEMKLGATACLSGGTRILVALPEGKASEEEVRRLWDCSAQSLKTFTQRTRGEQPGLYKPQELRSFLHRYFLKDTRISDQLLAELMELKRTLVGGRADVLTVDEIEQARQFIQVMKNQVLRLRPYFPLTVADYAKADDKRLQEAVQALEDAGRELGRVLKGTGYDYQFSHLESLLKELELLSIPEIAQSFRAVRESLPLLENLKALLIAPEASQVGGDQWEYLFESSSRAFGLMLRYAHGRDRDPSWVHGAGRENLVSVAQDIIELLNRSVQRYPDGVIPFDVIDQVIDRLDFKVSQGENAPTFLEHLKALVKTVVQKVLVKSPNRKRTLVAGLTSAHLQRASDLITEWSEGQKFLDLIFEAADPADSGHSVLKRRDKEPGASKSLHRSELLARGITEIYGKQKSEIPVTTWTVASLLRNQISRSHPFFGRGEEMRLAPIESDPTFSYSDLTALNLSHFLARLLVSTYSTPPQLNFRPKAVTLVQPGLTEKQFGQAYQDLRDLAIDLKLADPLNTTIYVKRFLEANLFTFAADGDNILSVDEASELLIYLFSSKMLAKRAHHLMADLCNYDETPALDIFGEELVDPACYRREFFRNYAMLWKNLPGLKSFYSALDSEQRTEFAQDMELVARPKDSLEKAVTSADSETLAGLSLYLETIFLRFDRDRNGLLEGQEVTGSPESAFSLFKHMLFDVSCKAGHCLDSDDSLEELFTYLFAHGEIPDKWDFIKWRVLPSFEPVSADRARVVKILSKMSAAQGRALNLSGKNH